MLLTLYVILFLLLWLLLKHSVSSYRNCSSHWYRTSSIISPLLSGSIIIKKQYLRQCSSLLHLHQNVYCSCLISMPETAIPHLDTKRTGSHGTFDDWLYCSIRLTEFNYSVVKVQDHQCMKGYTSSGKILYLHNKALNKCD